MNSLWMDVEHSVAKFGNFIYIQYIYKKILMYISMDMKITKLHFFKKNLLILSFP